MDDLSAYVLKKSKKDSELNITYPTIRKIKPINEENILNEGQDSMDCLKKAKFMNTIAKVAFAVFMVIFNIVFWYFALQEYVRPAEEYINIVKV